MGFAVLRIALTLVLLFFIAAFAITGNGKHQTVSYQAGVAITSIVWTLLIGALPMALARFRNLRGITYSLLISAIIEVLWQGSTYEADRVAAAASVEPFASFTSKDGLITLHAPQSWKVAPNRELRIGSDDTGSAILTVTEDAAKFAPSFSLVEYLGIAERAFSLALSANFSGSAEARTVAGGKGMRVPFDATVGGRAMKGYLYVVQGDSHLHALAAVYAPDRASIESPNVTGYVEHAAISDVH